MRPVPKIAGVPDELIVILNDRFRSVETPVVTASDSAALPNVGTPGRYTKVTTDAQGRVIAGGQLQTSDLPGGGYPAQESRTVHDAIYTSRSSSISTVTVSGISAGRYLFSINLSPTVSGAGSVQWTFSWTSNGVTRTIPSGSITLTLALTTSAITSTYLVNVDASTNFTYAVNYSAPGSYEFSAILLKL